MNAIPKALAMANPTHVAACVTTIAGVITSKFAIDAVANKKEEDTKMDDLWDEKPYIDPEREEMDDHFKETIKCRDAYIAC